MSNEATCVLCMAEKPLSEFNEEHVFPDAIGGSLVLRNSLCTACNSHLGHVVDADLTNNDLIELARLSLKIKGKGGAVPNPLSHGHVAEDPSRKLHYHLDKGGTPEKLYHVTSVETEKKGEGIETRIIVDASERDKIPKILKRIAQRSGVTISDEQIEEALKTPAQSETPWMKLQLKIHLSSWRRALIKIAYELACHWLPQQYLSDPLAALLREILRSDSEPDTLISNLGVTATIAGNEKIIPLWTDNPALHLAFLMNHDEGLACYVRVFQSFEAVVPVSSQKFGVTEANLPSIFLDAQKREHRELHFPDALAELLEGKNVI